jgi:hypothetical protein
MVKSFENEAIKDKLARLGDAISVRSPENRQIARPNFDIENYFI